jgi:hypothetical protein
MFARSDRSTKPYIVGYLGVVVGATLMLLSANAGFAAAAPAPKLDQLTLTALCTLPEGDAVFRVGNTNNVGVSYTWDIDKTSFSGSGTATPGHSYLYVPPSHENLRVYVGGKQQLAPKQDADLCVFHVQPVKRWVDADGHELESPDVPKFWKLTLESDIETLICTWKKDSVFCRSKADLEEKGEFAVEKRVLDVPFGSSYTITESATADFEQEGTGPFGPLAKPNDLTAFFNSDENIVATVTNRLVEEEVVAATTTAAATTTEAPTTTLAVTTTLAPTTTEALTSTSSTTVEEESTTSTTAEEESTTTTSTTIESLIAGESVTTAPTTTAAPTTTFAPTTTLAPPSTFSADTTAPADGTTSTSNGNSGDPESSELLPSDDRAPELTGDQVDPASVGPTRDSLPVTGGQAGLVAGLGFALVVAGLAVLAFAWCSATPGRHARRHRLTL